MKTLKKTIDRYKRHARIRTTVHGTSKRPRLVIFKSLQHNYVQLIDDDKGKTLASASDLTDKKSKSKPSERAKNIGLKIAQLAKEKKITTCVFDRNGYKYHGRVKAVAEGAREGGLQF